MSHRLPPFILSIVLLWAVASPLLAGPVLNLDDTQGKYALGPWLEILEDPSGKLGIDDVSREPYASRFSPSRQTIPTFGFTTSVYWIRLRLRNGASSDRWLLEQHYANTHYLDLYRPSGDGFVQRLSGNLRPPDSRDLPHQRIVFKLPLPHGAEQVIYLRLQTGASSTIDLNLWQPEAFANADHRESFWMGVFYGMLLIFLGYSLMAWLALGESSHLLLSLFVAAILTTLAFYDGYAQRLFATADMAWSRYAIPLGMGLTIIGMLGFIRRFLPPPQAGAWRTRLHPVHLLLWAAILALMPLLPYAPMLKLVATVSMAYILYLLVWAFMAWREGQSSARLYLSGWTLFLLGSLWILLVRIDWIEPGQLNDTLPIRIGLVWLVLFTSLAQANRLNHLMQESARIGKALHDSEEQRRLAMQVGGIGTWSCDPGSRHIWWSPETEALAGLEPGGFIGTSEAFSQYVHRDDWPTLKRQLQSALRDRTPLSTEFRIVRNDNGETRWMEIYGEALGDDDGRAGSIHGTVQDITERKQREARARQAEETLKGIAIAVSAHTGEAFFRELVLNIAKLFHADYILIGLPDEHDFEHIRSIALCVQGKLSDNISFAYGNDPCERLMAGESLARASGLRQRFPHSELLDTLKIEAFVGTPLLDSRGQVLGLIAVLNSEPLADIEHIQSILHIFAARTSAELQRLQTEQALRGTEQRLAQHILNTPVGVIEWNTRLEVTAWNPAAERIFGYTEAEALGRHAAGLILPREIKPELQRVWDALMAQDGGTHNTNENLTKDGRSITCNWYNTPLIDDEGKVIGVASLVDDITEWVQAQAELARHRDHLEELVAQRSAELQDQARIIEQVHDSVMATDLQGIVTYWNRGAERQLGYRREEALGRYIGFVHPPDEQALVAELIRSLREHEEVERELQLQRRNGERFSARLSLSLRYDGKGHPCGIAGIAIDISERKQAEAELERQRLALENTNRELEAFSYAVSHDLRAPLRALNGFSQALLEDYGPVLDDNAHDYIRRLRSATLRMSDRIDSLLTLSRLSRSEMQRQPLDLSRMAHAIAEQLQASDPQRQVKWEIAGDIRAEGDEQMLNAVLDNLLGNAWKYSARNPRARIRFEARQDGDGNSVYVVSDNGVGFDMRFADKLFGAFQRLHHETDFPGSGVGLATVARIVHRHGGRVWAEAEPGKGARFYFTLS